MVALWVKNELKTGPSEPLSQIAPQPQKTNEGLRQVPKPSSSTMLSPLRDTELGPSKGSDEICNLN